MRDVDDPRVERAERERVPTPLRVWITAALGGVLGLVALCFSLSLTWNLRLVWLAVLGLFVGGAAWVMAALVGSRKRWGMLAVLLCLCGIVAPLVVTAAVVGQARELSKAQDSQQADSTYDESAAAAGLAQQVASAAAIGSSQFVADQAVTVSSVAVEPTAARKALSSPVPEADGAYVSGTLEIENTSHDALDPALTLGIDLVTPAGKTYDSTACPATTRHPLLKVGTLQPDATGTAQVCFDVPSSLNQDTLASSAIRVSDANDPEAEAGFWATAD